MVFNPHAAVCKGKSRRTGEPCRNVAITGRQHCKLHGGKTLRGIAHPDFKDGKKSKYMYLPEHLASRVSAYVNDEKLIELRESIAVVDARLTELYERVESNESQNAWHAVKQIAAALKLNRNAGEPASPADVDRIIEITENGLRDRDVWDEIVSLTEQRRKLVESESKRMKDAQTVITSEEFMKFVSFVLTVIKENVTDRKQIDTISAKLIEAGTNNPR